MELSADLRQRLLDAQRDEITGYHVYMRIAATLTDSKNRQIMQQIAKDELGHYNKWKKYTGQDVSPHRLHVWFYVFVSRVLGFTFGARLLEQGEAGAEANYAEIAKVLPEVESVIADEQAHEDKLLDMLDEERLRYASSVVLGLNDALVELTGALAGLTLALRRVDLIALSGLITGVAASLSMGASEYLSTRAEKTEKNPARAAVYTGIAYIITVALLILPYLLLSNEYLCLAISLTVAVLIISAFNFYIAVANKESFARRFVEMAGLSLGVATLSFIISYFIRLWLGVEV